MNVAEIMKGTYTVLSQDETLLRLLEYAPNNQNDNPLDPSKPNILDLPIEQRFDIIDKVLYSMDKKFRLDLDSRFSRVNYYLNERRPDKVYSSGARKLINNPMVSKQGMVFDIYTNIEIDRMDFRMYSIIERLGVLLNGKSFKQLTGLSFNDGYTIKNTPDGFIGYRLVYSLMSPQLTKCN